MSLALKLAFAPLLVAQAIATRRRALVLPEAAGPRRHDEALAHWAAGRENVSHIGIALELDAGAMARDGFHPGEPVYRICGAALALHIADDVWAALPAGSGDEVRRAREGTTTEGRRT